MTKVARVIFFHDSTPTPRLFKTDFPLQCRCSSSLEQSCWQFWSSCSHIHGNSPSTQFFCCSQTSLLVVFSTACFTNRTTSFKKPRQTLALSLRRLLETSELSRLLQMKNCRPKRTMTTPLLFTESAFTKLKFTARFTSASQSSSQAPSRACSGSLV